jgi:hypothetical protein
MRKIIALYILTAAICCGCEKIILGPGPENKPSDTFEVLWNTLDEKYALFPVKNVNWDSLHSVYANQIDANTTEEELWSICSQLLSHLKDAHITLFNSSYTRSYCPWQADENMKLGFSIELIKNKFLVNPKTVGEGNITYGKIINTNIGYVYIATFFPSQNGRDWIQDLDIVLQALHYSDGMIIDIRNNPGGFSRNDLYLASAFIDNEINYFNAWMKNGPGHDDFDGPFARVIVPRNDTLLFTGNKVLLTNRFSSSGSEVVALILKNAASSMQIGDTTTGCFGDVVHVAELPNGWTLNYPCVLYKTPAGESPEGIGVIPDICILNTKSDIEAGNDKVLKSAITSLFPDAILP